MHAQKMASNWVCVSTDNCQQPQGNKKKERNGARERKRGGKTPKTTKKSASRHYNFSSLLIGRRCDWSLNDSSQSRRHCFVSAPALHLGKQHTFVARPASGQQFLQPCRNRLFRRSPLEALGRCLTLRPSARNAPRRRGGCCRRLTAKLQPM